MAMKRINPRIECGWPSCRKRAEVFIVVRHGETKAALKYEAMCRGRCLSWALELGGNTSIFRQAEINLGFTIRQVEPITVELAKEAIASGRLISDGEVAADNPITMDMNKPGGYDWVWANVLTKGITDGKPTS